MAHVGVSIDDETKGKWANHVEESDFGTMSELIRTAVRKEIRRDGSESGGVPRELEKDVTRVAETQTALQDQMGDLADSFEAVADTAVQSQYPEEVIELGHYIAGDLEEMHTDRFSDMEREVIRSEFEEIRRDYSGDVSHGQIADALDYLEKNLSYVKKKPTPPSEYYRLTGSPRSEKQSEEYRDGGD